MDNNKSLNERLDDHYKSMMADSENSNLKLMDVQGHIEYNRLAIKMMNKSDNEDPDYSTDGASGFDFRADLSEPVTLKPLQRVLIPTGLYYELPKNIELQVRPRSGLAAKHGITVLNSPGTIDSDYRGEVKIILVNLSNEDFTVFHGERIAQGVLGHSGGKNLYKWEKVDSLSESERGEGGFGSTGTK